MTPPASDPAACMRRAIELARKGRGFVEPNPRVGAVIVDALGNVIVEGYHERFGAPHAEINALAAASDRAVGATMYVTLEPCCRHGKTGPCTEAIIQARVAKVVMGAYDPTPQVTGLGVRALQLAGIPVEFGPLRDETERLVAPFTKLVTTGLPYVHAKWAITLDGKMASPTGQSRWISSEASRRVVHQLRGVMDAIVVGSGTALADDPQLTARPPGPRTPVRIVVDSSASLSADSQLVRTCRDVPVIVAATSRAPAAAREALTQQGVECLLLPERDGGVDLNALLAELGRRKMTNVLVEGGATLFGSLFAQKLVDEVHVFVAPKIMGEAGGSGAAEGLGGMLSRREVRRAAGEHVAGDAARTPDISLELPYIDRPEIEIIGGDVYIHGMLGRNDEALSINDEGSTKRE